MLQFLLTSVYTVCRREKILNRQKIINWLVPQMRRNGIYASQPFYNPALATFDFNEDDYKRKNAVFITGPWENSAIFNDIRDILLDEFTPKMPPKEENKLLYDIAESTESVCISVRRGDYESNPKWKGNFSICHKEYFEKAIALMKTKLKNPVFIMFSDDIEWVKNNISIDGDVYYESGNDPVWEKLRLMYSCKHFIISNSTFSWWAQYLSRNPEKIVISPNKWFLPDIKWPLIESSFLQVEC